MESACAKVKWTKPLVNTINVSQTQATCSDPNKPNTGGDGGASECS